jgi:pimeloyl-ACP methyl ester carboxylesterase
MSAISIVSKGSYHIGGKKVVIEGSAPVKTQLWKDGPSVMYDPNGEFEAGQMYVQYTRLENPVLPYPVCMIHGGGATGALFESTQTGGPGWEYTFLQNGFNVNVSDGVERGRSSWAQFPEINEGPPMFNSFAERWTTYRLGPKYGIQWDGSRFDYSKYEDFMKQQVPRWTTSNPMVQKAYNEYFDSMTEGCIILSHSQGGFFTMNSLIEHSKNVKGVILVESSSTIDVNKTDVSHLKDIPFLFVFGDFLDKEYVTPEYTWVGQFGYEDTMLRLHKKLLSLNGDSTWIHLPDLGIRGNTHAMMIEDNSAEIADIICDWIKAHVK